VSSTARSLLAPVLALRILGPGLWCALGVASAGAGAVLAASEESPRSVAASRVATPVLAERLAPHSKYFGAQIIKFSPNPSAEIQQQFIRKNLLNVRDSYAAHIEILDSYLKDSVFRSTASERVSTLQSWVAAFEKEKIFSDTLMRFDRLYLKLHQAAAVRASRTDLMAQLATLEKDVLAFVKDEPKLPWAQLLAGLTRQIADAAGAKSGIEREKEFYFAQGALAAADDAAFHFLLGQLYLESVDRGDPSTFLKLVATEFEKCLLIENTNNQELWSAVTAIYVDIHEAYQKKEASEPFWFEELVYKRIIKLDPTNASAHNNLSFLYSQNGVNLREALKEAQIANQLKPNDPFMLDSLGWALYKNKQLSQALEVLKKAAALKNDIADVHFHLATVYFDRDDFTNASREFKKTIELEPANAFAKNNLAYLYAEKGVFLDDGLKLVDDALAKFPDNPAFIDTRGWLFFKQKKYDQAIEALKRAIELMPETSDLHLHLGTVFLTVGRFQEAAQHFEKALTYDPGNPQIARDLSFAFALHGVQTSLERYRKISGVDRARENFKIFHDLIAQIQMAKGDYLAAQKALEEYRNIQSREEPEKEEPPAESPGTEEEVPRPGPAEPSPPAVPSPAPLPARLVPAAGPRAGVLAAAARLPADTDVFIAVEKAGLARLVDHGLERARAAGHTVVFPAGRIVAEAVVRVCLGMSLATLKGTGRSCGLAVMELAPMAAGAIHTHLGMFQEGTRTVALPMGMRMVLTATRYRNRTLYHVALPQGAAHFLLLDTHLVMACQKSELVGVIDRIAEPAAGLDAHRSFKLLVERLGEAHDALLFARAGGLVGGELALPPPVAAAFGLAEAIGSSWTFGKTDELVEESLVLPGRTASIPALKAAFEGAARALSDDLKKTAGGKAKLDASFAPADGVLKGTLKLTGVSSLLDELVGQLKRQVGQEGLTPPPGPR
jgi:tetratricopeptide (TPR) repeat protein